MKKLLTSVSLFSGCMGLDLGLEAAGIETVACVESDAVCRETIRVNRPEIPCLPDVCAVTGAELERTVSKPIDVMVGGPPCQSFSTMGHRAALADGRGRLIMQYLRLLGEIRPRVFALENVVGLLYAERNGRPLLPWLVAQFEKLGYTVGWWKLDATDYGSPQMRQRIIVVGSLSGTVRKPEPCAPKVMRVGDVIEDLEDRPGECGSFGARTVRFLKKIPEGGNWRALRRSDQKIALGNANPSSGGLCGYYRRLSYDKPSPTLLTSPTQKATLLCHPKKERPLSILEYARIQGFPARWHLAGGTAQKYRQLGNAVPVTLAEAIGTALVAMVA